MVERSLVPLERVERSIVVLRGQNVLLDEQLAALYGVAVKVLNQTVKRNQDRFPEDFMFRLTADEAQFLRSQTVTLETGRGRHRKYLPYAFTEHGAIMLASVLNSPRAIEASVWVVRAFVKLREALAGHKLLLKKLAALEAKIGTHDREIGEIIRALRSLMAQPPKKNAPIGFQVKEPRARYGGRLRSVKAPREK